MSDTKSIVSLGDYSKPANTLIEKISDALGGIFKPWQMKRTAIAEAQVKTIATLSKIETTDIEKRAMTRFIYQEGRQQENIESIALMALPQVKDTATPKKIEEDWITNFFEKCRNISDIEMQMLWSKVLSGEANTPGAFSKRTINFMDSLDKNDALLFKNLCGYCWTIGSTQPLIFDISDEIYKKSGITFEDLKHLNSIGLISYENLSGYKRDAIPKVVITAYRNTKYKFEFQNKDENSFRVGKVILTAVGTELANVCEADKVEGFEDYIIEKLKDDGISVSIIK